MNSPSVYLDDLSDLPPSCELDFRNSFAPSVLLDVNTFVDYMVPVLLG